VDLHAGYDGCRDEHRHGEHDPADRQLLQHPASLADVGQDRDVTPVQTCLGHTRLTRPAIVPEIELHLVDDIVALWKLAGEDNPPPFWAVAWLGGQALARYVLDHPSEVAGRRVLDLGSGSGLVAIAAALVDVCPEDPLTADPPDVDVILAGDVWYERDLAERVVTWLGQSSARVLLGDPGRAYLPLDGWTQLASYDVPTTRDLEGVQSKRVRVFSPAPR